MWPDRTPEAVADIVVRGENSAALQPAIGMAVATLIVRSVTATIRHKDKRGHRERCRDGIRQF